MLKKKVSKDFFIAQSQDSRSSSAYWYDLGLLNSRSVSLLANEINNGIVLKTKNNGVM